MGRIVFAGAMSHVLDPDYYDHACGPVGRRMVEEVMREIRGMGDRCVAARPPASHWSTSAAAATARTCRPDCGETNRPPATGPPTTASDQANASAAATATDHTSIVRPVSRSTAIRSRPPSPRRTGP